MRAHRAVRRNAGRSAEGNTSPARGICRTARFGGLASRRRQAEDCSPGADHRASVTTGATIEVRQHCQSLQGSASFAGGNAAAAEWGGVDAKGGVPALYNLQSCERNAGTPRFRSWVFRCQGQGSAGGNVLPRPVQPPRAVCHRDAEFQPSRNSGGRRRPRQHGGTGRHPKLVRQRAGISGGDK